MLWALIIGLLVGTIAKFLMPGRDPGGFIMTIVLGIVGAIVANWAGSAFGAYGPNEPAGFLAAVLGAMAVLFFYRMMMTKRLN